MVLNSYMDLFFFSLVQSKRVHFQKDFDNPENTQMEKDSSRNLKNTYENYLNELEIFNTKRWERNMNFMYQERYSVKARVLDIVYIILQWETRGYV